MCVSCSGATFQVVLLPVLWRSSPAIDTLHMRFVRALLQGLTQMSHEGAATEQKQDYLVRGCAILTVS